MQSGSAPDDTSSSDTAAPAAPRTGPLRRGGGEGASSYSETWSPGPRCFLGPLLALPKATGSGDKDVWLVTTVHTAGGKEGGKDGVN